MPVIDHSQSGVVYNVGRFCLSVCLSVCMHVCVCVCVRRQLSKALMYGVFILAHPVYGQAIRVTFVYEGHRVKVKVTVAENVQTAYSRNVNFDRP